jgi:hypothetical protein
LRDAWLARECSKLKESADDVYQSKISAAPYKECLDQSAEI